MLLRLSNKIYALTVMLAVFFCQFCLANEAVECPKKIVVENGKVIDTYGWNYSVDNYFLNEENNSITMKDGMLVSDYKFPEISQVNSFTNSVAGGLSYDEIEERDDFLSLTWNVESISRTTTAVYICDFHGDSEETPIRIIYLYKAVPKQFKKCTVTYELIEYERIPESQRLFCE